MSEKQKIPERVHNITDVIDERVKLGIEFDLENILYESAIPEGNELIPSVYAPFAQQYGNLTQQYHADKNEMTQGTKFFGVKFKKKKIKFHRILGVGVVSYAIGSFFDMPGATTAITLGLVGLEVYGQLTKNKVSTGKIAAGITVGGIVGAMAVDPPIQEYLAASFAALGGALGYISQGKKIGLRLPSVTSIIENRGKQDRLKSAYDHERNLLIERTINEAYRLLPHSEN